MYLVINVLTVKNKLEILLTLLNIINILKDLLK